MRKRLPTILACLLPVQYILIAILSRFPQFIEFSYSRTIFPIITQVEHFLLGWIPFSIGDILYLLGIVLLIRWLYKRIKTKFKSPKQWSINAIATLSVIYFCFHLFWGLNYYRLPLHKNLHIQADYTHHELVLLTEQLIQKANFYQEQLTPTDSTKVSIPYSREEVNQLAISGYQHLAQHYPTLNYQTQSIKSSLFSTVLTYMGFSGYINPWTNEAQINAKIPSFKWPSVTAHEMGHQLGYAKENEANFMACLNTISHTNPYFKYAGYTFALQYCLNEVYLEDKDKGKKLLATLNPGVRKNYAEVQQFWEAHQNPFEPIFKYVYGKYLKVNNQPEGMQSYSYVVALLVNYYQEHAL